MTQDEFERKLYVVRRRAEIEIAASEFDEQGIFLHSVDVLADHHL